MANDRLNPPGFENTSRPVPMEPAPMQYVPNQKPAPAYPVPPVYPTADPAQRISGDVPLKRG